MIRVAPEAADVKQSCKMCLPTTYVCCVGQICWHSDTKLVVRMVRMDLCVCVRMSFAFARMFASTLSICIHVQYSSHT